MSLHDALLAKAFGGGGAGSGSGVDVTASVGQTIVVEEVDANGKPTKWKAADYQERTHWSEVVEAEIIPQTTYTPVYQANFGCFYAEIPAFELEDGKTYTVIFDGTTYTCTALSDTTPMGRGTILGNPVFLGMENNGMPFCLIIIEGSIFWVFGMDGNEHTVHVTGEKTLYHKITEGYVPKADFVVEIESNTNTLKTPWEDIINAEKDGKNLYVSQRRVNEKQDEYGNFRGFEIKSNNSTCFYFNYVTLTGACEMRFLGMDADGGITILSVARDENGVTSVTRS